MHIHVLIATMIFVGASSVFARSAANVPDVMRRTRAEKVKMFRDQVYGVRPVQRPPHLKFSYSAPDEVMIDGKAVRKLVTVEYGGKYGTNSFTFAAFIPVSGKTKPVAAFVHCCVRAKAEHLDYTRKIKSDFWPVEEIVERGYAAIAYHKEDICPDYNTGNTTAPFSCFENVNRPYRGGKVWGTLSAWAWGASRILDWIETEPTIDAKHVAIVGHSRGGKTALIAAMEDERFAMACSNDSGCSGAKLNRAEAGGESVAQIVRTFPYWFCPDYVFAVNREAEVDYDQHELIASIAPRLVCIASATEDAWAGPRGEFESARLASPAWEAFGKVGLGASFYPAVEDPIQIGCISYHLRRGKHSMTIYDWNRYMDFADKHGWRR